MTKIAVEIVVTGLFAFVYGGDQGSGPTWLEILAPAEGAMHHVAEVERLEKGKVKVGSDLLEGVELSIAPDLGGNHGSVLRQRKADCPLTPGDGFPADGTDEATRYDWTVEMSCLDEATHGTVPKSVREDRTGKYVSTRIRLPAVALSVSTQELSTSTLAGKAVPVVTRFAPFKKSADTKSWQVTADEMLVRFELELGAGERLLLQGVDITNPAESRFKRELEIPTGGPVRLTLRNQTAVTSVCPRSTIDGLCTGVSREHFKAYYSLLEPFNGERPTLFPGVDPDGEFFAAMNANLRGDFKILYSGGGRPICMMGSFVAGND